jgi:transcriptional regulator with XRE-family HTH domain
VSFGASAGRQLARLSEERGLSQRDVARLLQGNGLEWSRDQVQYFESGQREGLEVREWVALSAAFGVPLAYWLGGPGGPGPGGAEGRWVALDGQMQVELGWLRSLVRTRIGSLRGFYGEPVGTLSDPPTETSEFELAMNRPLDKEEREMAHRLGITPEAVRALGLRLWRKPLVWRREELLGRDAGTRPPGRRTALRGHITRALTAEMREALKEDDQ